MFRVVDHRRDHVGPAEVVGQGHRLPRDPSRTSCPAHRLRATPGRPCATGPRRSTTCISFRNIINCSRRRSRSVAGDLLAVRQHNRSRFRRTADQELLEFALVLDERFLAAALCPEKRRLRDVDVAAIDEVAHLPVEERQQQRANVRSVDVGVRHDDDAVVPHLAGVELVLTDAASQRRDDRADLFVAEHLVEARFLDVEDLALDGQHRLELADRGPAWRIRLRTHPRRCRSRSWLDRAPDSPPAFRAGRRVVERALAAHQIPRLCAPPRAPAPHRQPWR